MAILPLPVVGLIKEYCWSDSDEARRELIEKSSSGFCNKRYANTTFHADHVEQILVELIGLPVGLGHGSDSFKESIYKICFVSVETLSRSPHGRHHTSSHRKCHLILQLVIRRLYLRPQLQELATVLPAITDPGLPSQLPLYITHPNSEGQGAHISQVVQIDRKEFFPKEESEEPSRKKQKIDHPPSSQPAAGWCTVS